MADGRWLADQVIRDRRSEIRVPDVPADPIFLQCLAKANTRVHIQI